MLTLGVRAQGLKAIKGWDRLSPFGGKTWDFSDPKDQAEAEELVSYIDPLITHCATPCDKLSQMALHPGQKGYSKEGFAKAESMVEFSCRICESREKAGGGGSIENPKGSRCWKLRCVLRFFGTVAEPKPDKYFAEPELCAYDLQDPGELGLFYRKRLVLAATYHEIQQLSLIHI